MTEENKKIMSKYSPESRTRHFEGIPRLIMRWMCVLFSIFMLAINTFVLLPPQVHRASFAGIVVLFAFLLYPARAKTNTRVNYLPWYDLLLGIIGMACFLYYAFNFETITMQMGRITSIDFYVAVVGMIILLIACNRVVGLPLIIVALTFLAYAYFGNHIPGMFGHPGFRLERIINHSHYQIEGILGVPMGVASTFIFVFLLFGAVVRNTGIGQFFIELSTALAGKQTGGPAKAAVIVSALQATICGSSVANTVSSGSFTIPMMKRLGYDKDFAGAVEASASVGGQLVPPILGAAAFIMSEITGIPFAEIALAALIPSIFYFVCVFASVHFVSKKNGLKGLPAEEIPRALPLILKKGYLMLGFLAIVAFLATGFTPTTAATYAIIVCIVLSMFRKETRLTPKKIFESLESAARSIVSIGIACAVAGIVVGVVTLTGLGITFANAMVGMAGGIGNEAIRMFAVLFFCMLASLVLGMGVPTTAKYVIMATVTAPILVRLGVPLLAAHMFVFYFGTDADITPPVALASYAAAAISKGDPMRTSVLAARIAVAAYIVPYVFVFNTDLLFIDPAASSLILASLTGVLGIIGVASGFSGFLIKRLNMGLRIAAVASGLLMIGSSPITDIAGILLLVGIYIWQRFFDKNENEPGHTVAAVA